MQITRNITGIPYDTSHKNWIVSIVHHSQRQPSNLTPRKFHFVDRGRKGRWGQRPLPQPWKKGLEKRAEEMGTKNYTP